MRTLVTLIITTLITITTFGQQGINYKALIKDDLGNVVANQSITVQFTILEGVAVTSIYSESHNPTTDANGIVVINIGEGTPISGTYNTITWGGDEHHLNVQVDIGSGLVDMGTSQFMTVPYALEAANVTGMEAIDEGNGIGWRLKGTDSANYGDIGLNAVDLSMSDIPSTVHGAKGNNSIAMGYNTEASGFRSTAMGNETRASGSNSTAMGFDAFAIGDWSTAMGFSTTAFDLYDTAMGYSTRASGGAATAMGYDSEALGASSTAMGGDTRAIGDVSTAMGSSTRAFGDVSTTMGLDTRAPSFAETVLGTFNTFYIPQSDNAFDSSDRLFVVGNGTSDVARSNALTVLKNGHVGIGNEIPSHLLDVDGRMRVTNGTTGTAGIWFSDGTNDRQFAGVNTHSATGIDQKWGVFNNGAWNFIVQGNGQVGVANTNPNVALDVIGSIEYTGTITDVSDKRLKENFAPIENALERIVKIDGYTYNMKDDETKKTEYGVVAQELQKVFPEMVSIVDKENGYLGVSYIQLIPVLINAMKDQQETIEGLKKRIEILESN